MGGYNATKQDPYKKLRIQILTSMIIVPVIPFVLIVIIGFYYFMTSLQTETISKMTRIVEDHCQVIEFFLNERKSDLRFIADSYNFDYLSRREGIEKVFNDLRKKSNAFMDLGVFNEAGKHVAYSGPYRLAGRSYKEAEWFKEVMKKDYYISDVFLGYRKVPHFVIALCKKGDNGSWVIRATIDTLFFNNMVEKVRMSKIHQCHGHGLYCSRSRVHGDNHDHEETYDFRQVFHCVCPFLRRHPSRLLDALPYLAHGTLEMVAHRDRYGKILWI